MRIDLKFDRDDPTLGPFAASGESRVGQSVAATQAFLDTFEAVEYLEVAPEGCRVDVWVRLARGGSYLLQFMKVRQGDSLPKEIVDRAEYLIARKPKSRSEGKITCVRKILVNGWVQMSGSQDDGPGPCIDLINVPGCPKHLHNTHVAQVNIINSRFWREIAPKLHHRIAPKSIECLLNCDDVVSRYWLTHALCRAKELVPVALHDEAPEIAEKVRYARSLLHLWVTCNPTNQQALRSIYPENVVTALPLFLFLNRTINGRRDSVGNRRFFEAVTRSPLIRVSNGLLDIVPDAGSVLNTMLSEAMDELNAADLI